MVKSLKERLEKARKAAAEKGEQQKAAGGSSRPSQNQHQDHRHHHNQQNNRSGHHQQGYQRSFDKNRMDPGEANIFNKNYKFKPTDEYDELGPAKVG